MVLPQKYGHPRVLGVPIPKTLAIWASPVTQTLTQIAIVIWEGDAHIPRVFEMGHVQNAEMPMLLWQRIDVYVNTDKPLMFTINPLSPESDQHQFSPNNIHTL